MVFLFLPKFGTFLSDEMVKETDSVFCLAFLNAFYESHEKSVKLPYQRGRIFSLFLFICSTWVVS